MSEHDITLSENAEPQEQYAEELAGPDDYWLTITDAARATRRQDVTIRRWIARGLLPVRRQHVGLNQRTRLVRASDLSALTPIIDPSGAISSERGKLDLTSIPVQQAQIKASQQDILAQIKMLHTQLKDDVERLMRGLTTQWSELQEAFVAVHNDIAMNATRQQNALAQHQLQTETSLKQQYSEQQQTIETRLTPINKLLSGFQLELQALTEQQTLLLADAKKTAEEVQLQLQSVRSDIQQRVLQDEELAKQFGKLQVEVTEQDTIIGQQRLHLAEQGSQIENLTELVTLQKNQLEQETAARMQLANQIDQISKQFAVQQELIEREAAARNQLEKRLERFAEQHTTSLHAFEQSQKILVTSLSEHQEHISFLQQQAIEQQKKYDDLAQYYVKLNGIISAEHD